MKNHSNKSAKQIRPIGKRGTWISWILFLGLIVALSSVIFMWARTTTTESTEQVTSSIEVRNACRNILFSIDEGSKCDVLYLTNRGTLNIEGFILRSTKTSANVAEKLLINEKKHLIAIPSKIQEDLNSQKAVLTIIPLVKIGSKNFGCGEKKVIFECPS